MDRRNGGDPLAPPRPPKSMPRVHRPRAPEPAVNQPSSTSICPQDWATSRMNMNPNETNSISSSINSSLNLLTAISNNHHRSIPPIPPATVPLTPLLNNGTTNLNSSNNTTPTIGTFSRRRTEMPQQRISARLPVPLGTRSLSPSSVLVSTPSHISNAINTVGGVNPSTVVNSVTLQIPRPENERSTNEYVDTPFTNSNSNMATPRSRHSIATPTSNRILLNNQTTNISTIDGILVANLLNSSNNNNSSINNNINNHDNNKIILPLQTSATQRTDLLPITKQPSFRSTQSKKDAVHQQFSHCPEDSILSSLNTTSNSLNINRASDQLNTITCPQCNRCRCEECKRPRQLPTKWFCDNNCYCSAETIIDYASCLCCVKALFYHCSKDHEIDCESETIRCAEDPCSCVPYKRASRWGCLSVLSILLPCLCCYWPMRGCVSLCAKCYAKHKRHGCRCNKNVSPNSTNNSFNSRQNISNLAIPTSQDHPPMHHLRQSNNNDLTPEKRLLDSPEY